MELSELTSPITNPVFNLAGPQLDATDPVWGRQIRHAIKNTTRDILNDSPYMLFVGVDTEGSPQSPWSVQISTEPGSGYTIRACHSDQIQYLFEWIRNHHPIISLHNSLFDLKMLKSMGLDLVAEDIPIVDTMILAYVLNIEPLGLKLLAYRHCGIIQPSYSDVIGDVGRGIAIKYLERVAGAQDAPLVEIPAPAPKLPRKRKKETEQEYQARVQAILSEVPPPTYEHQWPNPEPILVEDGGIARMKQPQGIQKLVNRILGDVRAGKQLKDGSLVDPYDRWNKLEPLSKAPVIQALGPMPEPTLDDIDHAKAVHYASKDADLQFRVTRPLIRRVKEMGVDYAARLDHAVLPCIARMQEVGIQLAPPEFWDRIRDRCLDQMNKAKYAIWKLTGREVNPGSGDQVAELLYGKKSEGGLELDPPIMTKGGESGEIRGSTGDKCLEALVELTPVVEHIMSYREADKVRGTYVEVLKELARIGPDINGVFHDGRVRCDFKVTRVPTGRFATANPNLLAIPVRSELGASCRDGFVAPTGKIMFDADLGQIEFRTFTHLSGDRRLRETICAGKDIHILTASKTFSVTEDNVEKWQRQAAKAVGFGIINGMTAKGLINQMTLYHANKPDGSKWSEDDCARMIQTWFELYPGARKFQLDCIKITRQTGLARDPLSGRIRYLPQIWSDDKRVREEAERCSYSHLIQTSANTILKRAMVVMWGVFRGMEGVEMLLPIHDEILLELPDREDDRAVVQGVVEMAMTTTTKLIVPIVTDGKFGATWGEAH